jgi:FkbM family methyltransferase
MIHNIERDLFAKLLPREGTVVNVGDAGAEIIQVVGELLPGLMIRDVKAPLDLDEFSARERIRRFSLLNLDIQGEELKSLRSATQLLRREQIDLIRFTHGPGFGAAGTNLYELFAFLVPFRYRLFKILPGKLEEKREILPSDESQPPSAFLAVAPRLASGTIGVTSILDIPQLFAAGGIIPRGVIHVGAHLGEERELYRKIGFQKVIFIEANPELAGRLKTNMAGDPAVQVINCAISDLDGATTLHVTSMDQSSSILPLKRHRDYYPMIEETSRVEVMSRRLETLLMELKQSPADFNFLHLDIQGAELRALRGAAGLLKHFDAIVSEVNFEELYEGCGLIEELDDLLESHNFHRRALACPYHPSWGDAFYVRAGAGSRSRTQHVLSMSSLGVNGRFANQIFQYAFLCILANHHGMVVQTPPWIGQKLFGHADAAPTAGLPQCAEGRDLVEGVFPAALFDAATGNLDLWGYFQYDTAHYAPYRDFFRSLFQPAPMVEEPLRRAVERLRADGRTVVGLHLRRGDYGYRQFFIAPNAWYLDLLRRIWPTLTHPVLFIASDEPEKVLPDFKDFNPVTSADFGLALPDAPFYPDFYLMTQCDVLCIANSSFSFAAAMLNERASAFYRPHQGLNRLLPFDPWNSPPLLNCELRLPLSTTLSGSAPKLPQQDAVRAAAARFSASTLDAAASQTLQDFRRVLAEHFINSPLEQLQPSYVSAAATLGSAILALSDLPTISRDMPFVQTLLDGLGAEATIDPRRLLAITLYRRACDLPLPASIDFVPAWFQEIYFQYVFIQPQVFGQIGDVDRYYQFLKRWVDYLREGLSAPVNDQTNRLRSAVAQFAQFNNFVPLYFCSENLKTILSDRADLIEHALRDRGHKIDFVLPPRPADRQRIRVGILAKAFSPGTETFHTLPHYEHLDRARIEVILFTLLTDNNPLEQYCRGRADRMVHLTGDLAQQVAALRAEDLDVLVVGSNVTAQTTDVALLAMHRVARAQMTLFSSPATSGIRNMDFFVSGKWSERDDAQDQYREQLIRLDGAGFCFSYDALQAQAVGRPTRQNGNIPEDAVVFASGANFFKIIPELIECWKKILAAVPNSILLLYPFGAAWASSYSQAPLIEQLNKAFAREGRENRRLIIMKALPNRATVKEVLKLVDVYLDSIRHAGGHSLIDPLEVGLPPVTIEGEFLRSRHGAAILRSIQAADLIAVDEADYIRRAIELGNDAALRRKWREHINTAMKAGAPFLDSRAFGAQMTEIYPRLLERRLSAFA